MSSINFDNVWLLFIALPLIVVFAIPFALAVKKENRNGHNVASMALHVLLSVVIAFAAAGTSIKTVLTETEVYVVADVSYSAHRNLDLIDEYISKLELPANSKLGLVCFGKNHQLISEPTDKRRVGSVRDARVDDSETNITGALTYTGTLFGSDVIKRIVLITDGKQTDESDSYALRRTVGELRAQNISVDAIYLNDNLSETDKEVQITGVDFTKTAYLGHEETATVMVQASVAVRAYVTLTCDGMDGMTNAAELVSGANAVNFELPTNAEGTFHYKATVRTVNEEDDSDPYNNEYLFTQRVSSEVRTLFITEAFSDCAAAIARFGHTKLDIYENDTRTSSSVKSAFKTANESDDVRIHLSTSEVPYTENDLCVYDEIVIADADVRNFVNASSFVESLRTVVTSFGKSLLAAGDIAMQDLRSGADSDSADDEAALKALSDFGDLLPLRYGNSEEDPKLYTIVFDASRSMHLNFHLNIAKEVAKRLVSLLNDSDEVCILTFWGENMTLQPPVALTNRERIYEEIDNIELLQGTVIKGALDEAQRLIDSVGDAYSEKQLMLITDGETFSSAGGAEGTNQELVEMAEKMYGDSGIVTSVCDVGRQGDNGGENAAAAAAIKQMLEDMAEVGHGKYFYTNYAESLGDLDFGELAGALTQSEVTRDTTVNIERSRDEVLVGLGLVSFPNVGGYYYTTAKPGTTTVLSVNHEKASGAVSRRPLYSYFKLGTGTVAAFTCKFSGDWLQEWENGNTGDEFFENVCETNVPAEKISEPYVVNLIREGTVARVEIAPPTMNFGAQVEASVVGPSGETIPIDLTFGTYEYFGEFDCAGTGEYNVQVRYSYMSWQYESAQTLSISYMPEYDAFAGYDSAELHKAIDDGGTVSSDGTLKLENDENDLSTYTVKLTLALLVAAVAIFVVDIIVRKLKWEDIRSFFGLNKRKKEVKRE